MKKLCVVTHFVHFSLFPSITKLIRNKLTVWQQIFIQCDGFCMHQKCEHRRRWSKEQKKCRSLNNDVCTLHEEKIRSTSSGWNREVEVSVRRLWNATETSSLQISFKHLNEPRTCVVFVFGGRSDAARRFDTVPMKICHLLCLSQLNPSLLENFLKMLALSFRLYSRN